MPNRLGWARPCPSHNNTSGCLRSFRSAVNRTGTSRKESSPGTYGKIVLRQASRSSTMQPARRSHRTTAARQRLPPGAKATSKPATYRNADGGPDSRTCAAIRRWIAMASRGRRFQRCGAVGIFTGATWDSRPRSRRRRQEANLLCPCPTTPPDVGADSLRGLPWDDLTSSVGSGQDFPNPLCS